ncbi:hypothetical protein DVH24_033425 [Malus domestica]|uniref:Ubiquitin-fold modifier-conjugating enzyme 1 n=2 Tax=Magnoliopsida TaxID=3398 RepID=A0A498J9S1_MALDO|nr:hypothetical protein DVH24_033425 [Malus domestica]
MEGWDPNTKSTLTQIPLLTTKAGPRDGAAWTQRLKEEYKALIAYTQMNKSNDNDWFRISAANPEGTRWTGKCWYVHNLLKYEFDLQFDIPITYPATAPELELPQLDGKTQKMYRGGKICLTVHFKPLWAKNCPRFGIAHALCLGLAPWLAAEIPILVDSGMPVPNAAENTVGKVLLKGRGLFTTETWFWICIGALFGFSILFNLLFVAALTFLDPIVDNKTLIDNDDAENKSKRLSNPEGTDMQVRNQAKKGMVLPFEPLSLAFNHMNYYVDMPPVSNFASIFFDMLTSRNQRRTVVCTIHQPSIDIFEAFDELFLMKRGGRVIYAGPLGDRSHKLVEYFEAIPGVPKIKEGYNPATWMLDVSSAAIEAQNDIDFAEIFANSDLYRRNQELIKELSMPQQGSKDLYFPTQFSQSFLTQCKACFWKQHWSYWRNSQYNAIRFFMTVSVGIIFGIIFWNKGKKMNTQQDIMNLLGAGYGAVLFLGAGNASAVQSVIAVERTVFYRERAAGMYSELPYAFSQVAIETLYVLIQTFAYSLILYGMIGFNWKVDKFLYFYYFIFMCFTYFSMYGMMAVALTPGPQIAAIVMGFFMSFWNLFSGFLVPRTLIPIWWRWYYWGSPIAWTIYGLFASQMGDVKTLVEIPGEKSKPVNQFLKDYLGFEEDFVIPVVFAHVGWVLLFFFLFAYGIKYLNFQRR